MKRSVRVARRNGPDTARQSGAAKPHRRAAESDGALFERLRTLRKRLADEADVPPYVVFSDAHLRDMCARRPATDDEFLQVSGVGPVKLERYGKAFLQEIAAFEQEESRNGEAC